MLCEITINLDNAIFVDYPGELSEILRNLASAMETSYEPGDYITLCDGYGNTVGKAIITE